MQRRPVPIPKSLAVRLRHAAGDRADDTRLLLRSIGRPWLRSSHTRLFADLRHQVGLGAEVSFYALRHRSSCVSCSPAFPSGSWPSITTRRRDDREDLLEVHRDHSDGVARRALLDLAAPPAGADVVYSSREADHDRGARARGGLTQRCIPSRPCAGPSPTDRPLRSRSRRHGRMADCGCGPCG